ncbi:class F sortase [Pseudonocardia petroleophila]|uniref:Class F sortase n=1 Tax=Pseudonocardia petroleophila TaxID=37331 RepID=A0A7G7MJT6_9PSEU|nr:class F sortase [Pseudonocardia petroleophila]QNG53047.1 class F sortase [Pseudonocardia petroleophila]
MVTGAGLACLVAGGALLLSGPGAPDFGTVPTTGSGAAVPAGAGPSAAPVVVGAVPVELALPGRGVLAPVVPVGTAPGGALVIPDPPSTVGWWAPGPLVGGASGSAVLAGHVDTAADGLGALAVLREVEPGEEVVVRGADGRELRYAVTARREYRKADLPLDLFDGAGPPGLVLITCGGAFDPATGHYEDNVVVHATPA